MRVGVTRDSPDPMYRQVAEILAGRIASGHLCPGDKTSELATMEEFGVSRVTIRQAFEQLEREGLIFRVPGKGTFIAEPRKLEPQSALTSFSENMIALGMEPGHDTLQVVELLAPADAASQLELGRGATVLHIERMLLANGTPMALMDAFLPHWVYSRGRDHFTVQQLNERSMYSIIEHDCGIQLWKARETVESAQAGTDAAPLGLEASALVLAVGRLTLTQDERPAEYTRLRYRADLYRYQVELYRHGAIPATPPRIPWHRNVPETLIDHKQEAESSR